MRLGDCSIYIIKAIAIKVISNITGIVTVGVTTIKSGEVEVVGVVTATTIKAGAAISITDGAVAATRFHGSGADLTGISSWEVFDTWLYGAG